ncbi:DUF998 domain-containing protein [Frigoribacterium sp. Leaf263]|uniref:DUF998 domain-containing protein n=1 Tax=Frigoribacterium sp. Leaf263 TaxID=1736313 RepID=UPI002E1091AD
MSVRRPDAGARGAFLASEHDPEPAAHRPPASFPRSDRLRGCGTRHRSHLVRPQSRRPARLRQRARCRRRAHSGSVRGGPAARRRRWRVRGVGRAGHPVVTSHAPGLVGLHLGAASVLFLVASQVPCTAGCPLPVGPAATVQDALHTSAAVVAFGAACVAMLQAACASGRRALRLLSSVCGVAVAGIAATGGLLSVAGVATAVGGWLELIATSIAISWLMVFGATSAFEGGRSAGAGAPVRRRRTTSDTSA